MVRVRMINTLPGWGWEKKKKIITTKRKLSSRKK